LLFLWLNILIFVVAKAGNDIGVYFLFGNRDAEETQQQRRRRALKARG